MYAEVSHLRTFIHSIELVNTIAIDIDECLTNNGGCSHICTNVVGSYYCKCLPGYTLEADNHDCVKSKYVAMYINAIYHKIFDREIVEFEIF